MQVEVNTIDDPEENYRHGDLWLPDGTSAEVKSQPIDPVRYTRNFVELFEVTTNPRHQHGFEQLCAVMERDPEQVAAWSVHDHRFSPVTHTTLGQPEFVSVSVSNFRTAQWVFYVNSSAGWLYAYRGDALLELCREEAEQAGRGHGLQRAMGRSNQDTFAVLVPCAPRRWQRVNGSWCYRGDDDETEALGGFASLRG